MLARFGLAFDQCQRIVILPGPRLPRLSDSTGRTILPGPNDVLNPSSYFRLSLKLSSRNRVLTHDDAHALRRMLRVCEQEPQATP